MKKGNQKATILKVVGIGMAVGGTAALLSNSLMSRPAKRLTKKNTAKVMKTIGEVLDNIQYMIK